MKRKKTRKTTTRRARSTAARNPRRAARAASGIAAIAAVAVPSGAAWVARFPGSNSLGDLLPQFGSAVGVFIDALRAAAASVTVSATFRPPERAYLMHYSWRIANGDIHENDVPPMSGVDIDWVHETHDASLQAARDMVSGYGLVHKAALASRHTERRAVDMTIRWSGQLRIADVGGTIRTIAGAPRDGNNTALHAVGAGYGVIKLLSDPPHWSEDGH